MQFLSIIIPFHSDTDKLERSIQILLESNYKKIIGRIYLCHNGADEEAYKIAKKFNSEIVQTLHTPIPGIGAGYKLGIDNCTTDYLLLTASDLPFNLTDIDQWVRLLNKGLFFDIVIGSKLHPSSTIIDRSFLRKLLTFFFMILKKVLIPLKLPLDTQGTIFIRRSIALRAKSLSRGNGFFFTTELITNAISLGASYSEVPVVYPAMFDTSSVSPLKESLIFTKNLFTLRQHIKREKNAEKK